MNAVENRRSSVIWKRRRVKLLSALNELGGEAPKEQLFRRLSTTPEFTTKGPKEAKLQPPEHYFKFVVTALSSRSEGCVQRRGQVLRITDKGREFINATNSEPGLSEVRTANTEPAAPEVRTVDAKSRLLLPKEFANATVTVERVGENEIRIRKAVVVPVDEFPFIEDQLKPLSDRDRDLFLHLLENPPEPTPALVKALNQHKKRHG
jgi:hypothetical protein